MPEKKHDAAIDADELMSESLGKLSAADFLTALQTKNMLRYVSVWPEKKKVEARGRSERLTWAGSSM